MDVKTNCIPQGEFSHTIINPWQNSVPSEIIVAICDTAATQGHGSYGSNGLYFEHCHLSFCKCELEGSDLQNSPIHVRYGDNARDSNYVDGYRSLLGFGGVQNVIPFNYYDYYNKGLIMYRFTLEEDESGAANPYGSIVPLRRSGNLTIKMSFEKALESPKTVYLFGLFASGFTISSNRLVKRMYP